jgi:hypothetical protein
MQTDKKSPALKGFCASFDVVELPYGGRKRSRADSLTPRKYFYFSSGMSADTFKNTVIFPIGGFWGAGL